MKFLKFKTLFYFFLVSFFFYNVTLYATGDVVNSIADAFICQSTTNWLTAEVDMDDDGVNDTRVRIIPNNCILEKNNISGNNFLDILYSPGPSSGSCVPLTGDLQLTIQFFDMADVPKLINFVSLITDANSVSGDKAPPFSPDPLIQENTPIGTGIRYTFKANGGSQIGGVTIMVNESTTAFLDELIISDSLTPGLVHLFDLSGSMNTDTDGNPATINDTRVELAKTSVNAFNTLLSDLSLAEQLYDDIKYGIAGFPNYEPTSTEPCDGKIIANIQLLSAFDGADVDDIPLDELNAIVNGLTASGNTPIFGGLETATSMLTALPYKNIVLLSDGYHNCPGVLNPSDYLVGGQMYDMVEELNNKHITVHAIAIGGPGGPDLDFLNALSTGTGGKFYDVTSATDVSATALNKTYDDVFQVSSGLDHLDDPIETISQGQVKSYNIYVNPSDEFVTFYVSKVSSDSLLKISITTSDGEMLPENNTGVRITTTDKYKIFSVYDSFLKSGEKVGANPWKLTIDASDIINAQETYHYSVITKSKINLDMGFDKRDYFTGDTMKIYLQVTENGKKLVDLKDLNIKIESPQEGLGNWLAKNKVTAAQIAKMGGQQKMDVLNFAQLKAKVLAENNMLYPQHHTENRISFNDNGQNGDKKAGDGIYTALYTNLRKEGTYKFKVSVSGYSAKTTLFTRETEVHKFVNVNIQPENVQAEIKKFDRGGAIKTRSITTALPEKGNLYTINLSVKDKFGNIPYPTTLRKVKLSVNNGRLSGGIEAQPDGSFIQVLSLPENVDTRSADLKLRVQIGDKEAEQVLSESPEIPIWMYIAALIIIIILIIIKRLKK